jgi:pimeloyl-ACP methyl ester carboxylesterase
MAAVDCATLNSSVSLHPHASISQPSWRLRYHDLPGSGVPLLFVHGLGCASSSDFPRVAADPALAGRRRLLLDLLGAGFSDRPDDFAYSVAAHAQTVAGLIGTWPCRSWTSSGTAWVGRWPLPPAACARTRWRGWCCWSPIWMPEAGCSAAPWRP